MQMPLVPPTSSRRRFVGGAIAYGLAGKLLRAAPARMFISLNGSLLPTRPAWPEFVRLAGRAGYGGADVSLDAAMKDGVDATRALFAEAKVRPGVAGLPVSLTAEEPAFQTALKRLGDVGKFLAAIDCPRMQAVLYPSSDTPKAELRRQMKDRISAISAALLPSKVRVGLEFLGPLHFRKRSPHEFIWRMNDTLEFAKECGPNIGLCLDAWHWHHAGATVADIVAAGKSRIVTIHVSDAKRQPPEEVLDNQRVLPGEGVIDLSGFFGALKKIGYEDAVSPEPIGRVPAGTSAEEGARMGLESTRAAMRKAGVA